MVRDSDEEWNEYPGLRVHGVVSGGLTSGHLEPQLR